MMYFVAIVFLFFIFGCKKSVSVGPPITLTTAASVYQVDASAAAVLTGLYTNISKGSFATGAVSISLLSGLSADEFKLSDAISKTDKLYYYYTNALFTNVAASFGTENWAVYYRYIYTCNAAIEGLNSSTVLSPAVKQQLLGEAKFMRAFLYFYLVNLYGQVPLAQTSDYEVNSHLSRAPVDQLYQQIINDLTEAKDLLADHFISADAVSSTTSRVRPTKWAAIALLARAYLYVGDYVNAESQANILIANTSLFKLMPSLNNVFLANSDEAIWQLQPVNSGWNTEDARYFVVNAAPSSSKPISISSSLYNSFEVGDNRKANWIHDTTIAGNVLSYPFKYKVAKQNQTVSEYLMVFRLGEQYLIRAEARAQLGNVNGAQSDLNAIRNRAGLPNYAGATDKNSVLVAILKERRVELFSEWGHRWMDLKRTANIDAVMTPASIQKGTSWVSFQQLYPIPYTEIISDPNMIQNAGY